MIPISDQDVKGAGPGYVTIGLVLINIAIFLYQLTLGPQGLESFFHQFAVQPAEILQGQQLYTLLTSMFLHGGWLHIISNMIFLWIFGDNIEAVLGRAMYAVFYIAGGVFASAIHVLMNPGSAVPSLGASGAIAAVLGAYIVMFPHARVKTLLFIGFFFTVTRVRAFFFLGLWALIQVWSGVSELGRMTDDAGGVAFWAHIGGFVFGLVVGFLLRDRAASLEIERA